MVRYIYEAVGRICLMKITRKRARELFYLLEEEHERIREQNQAEEGLPARIDGVPVTTLWERERKTVIDRLRRLPELVTEAAAPLEVVRTRGRKPTLDPAQKTMLFLFARLTERSNRDMEALLALLGPVFGFSVSYKTIERLYSDPVVEAVLHNLFLVLLAEEGVSGRMAGDGTGYSLRASSHYRSSPAKSSADGEKQYRHVFHLLDLETGMYVAFGYSEVSEKEAFKNALQFIERHGISFESVRLDKYYSTKTSLRELGGDVDVFVLPKKNLASFGSGWKEILNRVADDVSGFLEEYFQRELCESYFAADKERFGRKIRQRREDRREMACFGIAVLHNLFSVRVGPV